MGWHPLPFARARSALRAALLAACLALASTWAQAQNNYTETSNGYLTLDVGAGTNVAGFIGIKTTANNPTDPGQKDLIIPPAPRNAGSISLFGSRIYVRVDGGSPNIQAGGFDYVFGDQTTGFWALAPTIVGNHIEATWETLPIVLSQNNGGTGGGGTGGGGTGGGTGNNNQFIITNDIQVHLIASFVHDTVRFEFQIKNNETALAHSVGLAFVQDIVVTSTGGDGPLRLSTGQILHRETLLTGSAIPPYWETFTQAANSPNILHTIRGTVRPQSNLINDPTPPTRLAYGRTVELTLSATFNNLTFPGVWDFQPDPTVILDRPNAGQLSDASIGLYWDPQAIAPNATQRIITYLGQSTANNDFTPPMSLSVSAPRALTYNQGVATPSPFTVTAYVQNMSDILDLGIDIPIGPINLFLNLPPGLQLAGGDTANKQIASLSAGAENSVSWNVAPTGNVTGKVTFSVSATTSNAAGKVIQRTIEIPALPIHDFNTGFQMVSMPFTFGDQRPSAILGINTNPGANDPNANFDLLRWNPVKNLYENATTFVVGQAYWLRLNKALTAQPLGGQPSPLPNQVGAGATRFTINYPQGWNQIGDPYVYSIPISEILVRDLGTLETVDLAGAADVAHQWLLPAIFVYDPGPNPKYPPSMHVAPDNPYAILDFGATLDPYQGYWLRVNRNNLLFIFPTVDTPGTAVTRAAHVGASVGFSQSPPRPSSNNWRLRLIARGANTSDGAFIGVAPRASDGPDNFKLEKPPAIGPQINFDIVHGDWPNRGPSFVQDLRSPSLTRKSWDLVVRSQQPNEEIQLSWPDIAASVPRDYQLTLVDLDTNTRRSLRNTSSYTVKTGESGTRRIQIVAEPTRGAGRLRITSLDVVPAGGRAAGVPASVTINYTLSRDADARVTIRDARGRAIRTINSTHRAAGTANAGSAIWDLRDDRGAIMPSGLYNIELEAITSDGERSRQVRPYLSVR
ncbi:MAG TPA: FlgD immunoglobulin-like domain containing protein [Chthonomonadaceae bacterium]|nr:FlgD immunoglobulin-like domain containing protein [Chthonomonadaceae bacterium]